MWVQLYSRFNHQQTLVLPQARIDWINLRVLDFPDFASFNFELHRITAQLRLCGQNVTEIELIEKILSTFPSTTAILSQQYMNMKFKKHSSLMSHFLLVEKYHQLLIRNVESHPAKEIHTIVAAHTEFGGPIGLVLHVEAVKLGGPAYFATVGNHPVAEVHVTEASRKPSIGYFCKCQPKPHRHMARRNPHKPRAFEPRTFQTKQIKGNCHKCGRPTVYN